jgi:hypothetical protein
MGVPFLSFWFVCAEHDRVLVLADAARKIFDS